MTINESQANSAAAARVATSLAPRSATAKAVTQNQSGTSSSTSNSTITANDFLTLLVTEMQNQDPTQPTDPNAYIQQMVGVNSLQQLISINQGITTLTTGTSASPSSN